MSVVSYHHQEMPVASYRPQELRGAAHRHWEIWVASHSRPKVSIASIATHRRQPVGVPVGFSKSGFLGSGHTA